MNPPTDIIKNTFVRPLTWTSRIFDHSGHIWLHLCQTFDLNLRHIRRYLCPIFDLSFRHFWRNFKKAFDLNLRHHFTAPWSKPLARISDILDDTFDRGTNANQKIPLTRVRKTAFIAWRRFLSSVFVACQSCKKVVFIARLTSQDPLPFSIQFESGTIHSQKKNNYISLYFQMLLGAKMHILRNILETVTYSTQVREYGFRNPRLFACEIRYPRNFCL